MKTIKNTDKIRVFGVTFKDIHEAISYALKGEPKEGGLCWCYFRTLSLL